MQASEQVQERRLIAAVIGSARDDSAGESDATLLGRALVDAGFRVISGGMGGIMRAASRGARSSSCYQPGDIIGVLPSYCAEDANECIDIPICTGLQHGRNVIVVATADIVFAVGGRSGTLSEIALAWSLGKPVICVGSAGGWASALAGTQIDDRREDRIVGPLEPEDAAAAARELIQVHRYKPKSF